MKIGPPAGLALHLDQAVVGLDYPVDYCQTQAAPPFFSSEIAFKDPLQILGGDTAAGVLEGDFQKLPIFLRDR